MALQHMGHGFATYGSWLCNIWVMALQQMGHRLSRYGSSLSIAGERMMLSCVYVHSVHVSQDAIRYYYRLMRRRRIIHGLSLSLSLSLCTRIGRLRHLALGLALQLVGLALGLARELGGLALGLAALDADGLLGLGGDRLCSRVSDRGRALRGGRGTSYLLCRCP